MPEPSSREKIEAICETMDHWDYETLVTFAKEQRRALLLHLSAESLEKVYREDVLNVESEAEEVYDSEEEDGPPTDG